MIDGVEGITNQDARLANLISERGRGCILLINRWDLVKQMPDRNVYVLRDEIEQSLPHLSWAPTLYISAMTGKGTHRIIPLVHKVYQEFNRRISTSKVNNFSKKSWNTIHHHRSTTTVFDSTTSPNLGFVHQHLLSGQTLQMV